MSRAPKERNQPAGAGYGPLLSGGLVRRSLVKEVEHRRQEILLPGGCRDVEAGDPGLGNPDVCINRPLRTSEALPGSDRNVEFQMDVCGLKLKQGGIDIVRHAAPAA